jgi:hypothetical protein
MGQDEEQINCRLRVTFAITGNMEEREASLAFRFSMLYAQSAFKSCSSHNPELVPLHRSKGDLL